ncbi:MAG: type II toxin-antitoxin system HicB family antitoxin [Pseudomonadota bacterium]
MTLAYPVILRPDDNDTLMVTSPDFAELVTYGSDIDDALAHAADALVTAISFCMDERRPIPKPSSARGRPVVPLSTQVAMKVALYRAMRSLGLRKADLARRLGWEQNQVDRLLDPIHATRLDKLDAAFAVLGKRVSIEVRDAA